MDIDYIRYAVDFDNTSVVLNRDGQWQMLIKETCRLLDRETNLCTVHDTPRKPKTCVFFNPHRCWYRRNFHNIEDPPDLIRIDMEAFEVILSHLRFDEEGNIIEIPTWEFTKELVNNRKSSLASAPPSPPTDARESIDQA
jgi:hypothetical protein